MNYISAVPNISNVLRSEGDPKIIRSGPSSLGAVDRLAKGLGWFSLALGAVELAAPQRVTRALGMEGKESIVRAYGAREFASGVLTLSMNRQAGLWSRVAGDGLDAATLMMGLRDDNPKRQNVETAMLMIAGITLLDLACAQGASARHSSNRGARRMYRDRSGFPKGVQAARGAARDFVERADRHTGSSGNIHESAPSPSQDHHPSAG
jgi:hypothetical protein